LFIFSCKGSLTVQFLLGFILILSFVMLFSVMTFALAVSEVTQYITYAASRDLFLSHGSIGDQRAAAIDRYRALVESIHLKKFFQPDLFRITPASDLSGEGLGLNRRFPVSSGEPNLFYGVWTKFIPKVLEVDTIWGGAEENEAFFETTIGSYLGREPTITECEQFNKKRWELISNKIGSIPSARDPAGAYQETVYHDNGC
jgi:hypothetical protein